MEYIFTIVLIYIIDGNPNHNKITNDIDVIMDRNISSPTLETAFNISELCV